MKTKAAVRIETDQYTENLLKIRGELFSSIDLEPTRSMNRHILNAKIRKNTRELEFIRWIWRNKNAK